MVTYYTPSSMVMAEYTQKKFTERQGNNLNTVLDTDEDIKTTVS